MSNEITIINADHIVVLILPFVIIKPTSIGGTVHGTFATQAISIIPVFMRKKVTPANIPGVIINGIKKRGLKARGVPNIIGSLILKIPGPIDILPSVLKYLLLDRKAIKITNPIVAPVPPDQIIVSVA